MLPAAPDPSGGTYMRYIIQCQRDSSRRARASGIRGRTSRTLACDALVVRMR